MGARGGGPEPGRVLVLDDDPAVVEWLEESLREEGRDVEGLTCPRAALERCRSGGVELLLSDVEMPEVRGVDLLSELELLPARPLVVLMTAFGSVDLAVECLRRGAADFVTKPFRFDVLRHVLDRALRERWLLREVVRLRRAQPEVASEGFVARSAAMREVVALAVRAARTPVSVLITGETGVGKGHLARFLHRSSARRDGPFVTLNCAAMPANLVEAELFGVRRGAYTDAREDRPGLFVEANGGTLLLDEVGELPLESQPKLLRALESGRVRPLGQSEELEVDVRLIAATHQPLEQLVRDGRFREDLFYRLDVLRLDVPPLRDRPADIEPLVDALLDRTEARLGRRVLGVSRPALRWLVAQPWPGNVRELANTLERGVALAEQDILRLEDLLPPRRPPEKDVEARLLYALKGALGVGLGLGDLSERYMEVALAETGGNKSEAARLLGIDRRTLNRRIEPANG